MKKRNIVYLKKACSLLVITSFVLVLSNKAYALGPKAIDSTHIVATSPVLSPTNPITPYVTGAVDFLSAGVGVVVTIMVIVGAIQYTTSGGNPQAAADAKKKIFNAVLALVLYALMFAFLNFIIPGGIIQI